jgi:hypothetical protein
MPPKPKAPGNGRISPTSEDIKAWMMQRDELVAQMKRDGTWRPAFAPLLAEFAEALRMAAKLREAAEDDLFTRSERSGRSYAHPGIAAADIEVRRAALLLQRVLGMAKPRPAGEERLEDFDGGPLAELDAETQFDPDPTIDARNKRERLERMRASMKGRRK